ncbi:unnamed protein product [Orchesella dallaii]|uniref:Heterochromatin protein 1 n=1 Tax=Orchesella dallaii TaxID=48710 RepID=A0ABP1RYU2_9HEXA
MPTDKEKEVVQWDTWLLEAVRKIRTQKQRPGLDRIYNAVRLLAEKQEQAEHSQKSPIAPIYHVQFNQVKIEQVQRHLDRAVRKGLLLKVYSKGQATYKSVEKSERTLNLAGGGVTSSTSSSSLGASATSDNNGGSASGELSKCILKVIRELSECDAPVPTSSSVTVSSLNNSVSKPTKLGYTFETIEEYVRHSHVIIYPDEREPTFLPNLVRQALAKEVGRGKLELVGGEHYRLPSSGSSSSQGTTTSTSTTSSHGSGGKQHQAKSQNPSATTTSSSSNSNSSWSSSASSKSSKTNAPLGSNTFAGMSTSSSCVNKPVKSATLASSHGISTSSPLIKKDAGKAVKSGGGESATPPPSNSPPRPNLNPDLSEAEEIALVTEQTARAVMLVMKDRKPGEKPPNSSSASSSGGCSPKQKKSTPSPEPVVAVETVEVVKQPSPAHSSGGESCVDEKKAKDDTISSSSGSRRSSLTGDVSYAPSHKNGNGNGTAVIKLMVPVLPGRNGNGSNGNSKGASNKAPIPPSTSSTASQGSKGVTTVVTPAKAPENNNSSTTSLPTTTTTSTAGGAKSISTIASAIMNKKTNNEGEVGGGGGSGKPRSKNKKKNLASSSSSSSSSSSASSPSRASPVDEDNLITNKFVGSKTTARATSSLVKEVEESQVQSEEPEEEIMLEDGEYVIEKLVDKQEDVNGNVYYLVKWQGWSEENNTWELEDKFEEMPDLIQEYENGLNNPNPNETEDLNEPQGTNAASPDPADAMENVPIPFPTASPPPPPPVAEMPVGDKILVGFARGFKPKQILGAMICKGELCFMMEWEGTAMKNLVPAREANVKCPQIVIDWYESKINWNTSRSLHEMLGQPAPNNNNENDNLNPNQQQQ